MTASKPIVTVVHLAGSPPSPATTERSTASSDGSPLTPARWPSRSRGRRIDGCASTAASGRWTNAITPTMSGALLAREPEVVDVEDRHVGAPGGSSLSASVDCAGLADRQPDALGLVVAALLRHVDAGVDRVGGEVEQQRRVEARPVLPGDVPQPAAATAAARTAGTALGGGARASRLDGAGHAQAAP